MRVGTLVDLAGGGDPGLDGKSLRKVWQDGADQHREAAFISNVHPFWQKAIVTADYKLIWSAQPKTEHIWGNFTSKGKFFSRPWTEWHELAESDKKAAEKLDRVLHPQKLELYNVNDDPYEMVNLASNPEYKSKLEELHTSLKALMAEVGEPLQPQEPGKKGKKKKKSQP